MYDFTMTLLKLGESRKLCAGWV